MYLIGDIGNTETKCFILDKNFKKKRKIFLKTKQINKKYINKNLHHFSSQLKKIKYVLFCSVVPSSYKTFKIYFKSKFQIKIHELKQVYTSSLIKILVNKKQIGSDRLSNAISVSENKKNYIIVDFGTATTFDVVKKGKYLGGIIAPGVKLSLENLVNKASLIPNIKLNKISNIIGKNTISSVKSGFYWGYVGLIKNILTLIIKKTKTKYNIIFTGGLANLFKSSLHYKIKLDKDVTLKGLIKVIKSQNL